MLAPYVRPRRYDLASIPESTVRTLIRDRAKRNDMTEAGRIRLSHWIIRISGALAVVAALLGLAYNAATLFFFSDIRRSDDPPFLGVVFFALSFLCIALYCVLFACGIQLLRLRANWWWVLAIVCAAELTLRTAVRAAWQHPEWGQSIAMATGISMGGMMAQVAVYFPWWGPVLVFLAVRMQRLRTGPAG